VAAHLVEDPEGGLDGHPAPQQLGHAFQQEGARDLVALVGEPDQEPELFGPGPLLVLELGPQALGQL